MSTDEIKQAEKRGYSKGYAAGNRRRKRDNERERERMERQAFLDKAFLAALPAAMTAHGWTRGEKPINTTEERVGLARSWAREALKQRPIA